MYTLKQMEAFHWSAVLGSFNAASKRLYTTQSAISKRVSELESFAGAPLFERDSRKLVLTQHGRRLFEMSTQLLALNNRIVRDMADSSRFEGTVRLGVTELSGLTWLARLIRDMGRRFPNIQLLPEIDGGITLYERLEHDSLDLAIMPGPFWSYEYESVPLGFVTNAWMASPDLDIDFEARLTPQDLEPFPVISQPTTSALSHLYDAWFAEQGLALKRVLTCNSLDMMARLTVMRQGISHLPRGYFGPLVERGILRELEVSPALPQIQYYAVFKRSLISHQVSLVVDMIRENCDFEAGDTLLTFLQA
ncbi:LysR family transcriptional regulator [Lampropedia puyangensis]|uniref:LysR family transcriptional regulator n=1 Tax=Lampropedia puyangensis TaxID=1330072 RepID=A0A4S8EWZ3_9BURK|nr:LysR family transcriptional regulator [Lampropedia puyangensis]THT99407.1 LysR family transcriptional regulator [Lampropedia puyangensis]